jgi:hypothetical protein
MKTYTILWKSIQISGECIFEQQDKFFFPRICAKILSKRSKKYRIKYDKQIHQGISICPFSEIIKKTLNYTEHQRTGTFETFITYWYISLSIVFKFQLFQGRNHRSFFKQNTAE